jgi:hypothetical protein
LSNFKSPSKRQREQAKLDKRQAKDRKRAVRKAERSGAAAGVPAAVTAAVAPPTRRDHLPNPGTSPAHKPMTLADAVERWKKTKPAKPKRP